MVDDSDSDEDGNSGEEDKNNDNVGSVTADVHTKSPNEQKQSQTSSEFVEFVSVLENNTQLQVCILKQINLHCLNAV